MGIDKKIQQLAKDLYKDLIKMIEEDSAPWQKPWQNDGLPPHNIFSGTIYKGTNILRLMLDRYLINQYITFNQAIELGGRVKKGEKARAIIFKGSRKVKPTEIDLLDDNLELIDSNNKKINISNLSSKEKEYLLENFNIEKPFITFHHIFNVSQCENLDEDKLKELSIKHNLIPNSNRDRFKINDDIESILKNSGVSINHHNLDRAYCSNNGNSIFLPHRNTFLNEEQYYSTALHELGHATGNESRLNRDCFKKYNLEQERAKEELRAEIYSFIQAVELGIDFNLKNHASYVSSWIKRLDDKHKEIEEAIKDSIKMVEYVRNNWYGENLINSIEKRNETIKQNYEEYMKSKNNSKIANRNNKVKSNQAHKIDKVNRQGRHYA